MSIPEIADYLELPVKTVKRISVRTAPSITKPRKVITPDAVRNVKTLIGDYTNGEIATALGISLASVKRIIVQFSLSRTPEQNKSIRSRIRSKMISSERRRVLFGLDQHTNLKVFSNRERNMLRGMLRKLGYIVKRNDMLILYDRCTRRNVTYEMRGAKLGLSFAKL